MRGRRDHRSLLDWKALAAVESGVGAPCPPLGHFHGCASVGVSETPTEAVHLRAAIGSSFDSLFFLRPLRQRGEVQRTLLPKLAVTRQAPHIVPDASP